MIPKILTGILHTPILHMLILIVETIQMIIQVMMINKMMIEMMVQMMIKILEMMMEIQEMTTEVIQTKLILST